MAFFLNGAATAHHTTDHIRRQAELKRLEQANAPTCHNQNTKLESHILKQPKNCHVDADCKIQYLHIDGCVPAYLINKEYVPDEDKELIRLQSEARKACKDEYSKRPPCSPQPVTPVCHQGGCIPKSWLPIEVSKEAAATLLPFGRMGGGCAPHDEISWMMWFYPKAIACGSKESLYPMLTLNWWGNRPLLPAKSYIFDGKNKKDYQASFCPTIDGCVQVKDLRIEFERLDQTGAKGDYLLTFPDGRTMRSKFEINFCKSPNPVVCG